MTIRVLIIDDSATMRAILARSLSSEPDITVMGTAADAAQGRECIKQLNPDVITLDIEMPGMNGLDFLEKIMQLRPTPVIIVSGSTQAGTRDAARALALGAVDCYAKADRSGTMMLDDRGRLAGLVRQAAQIRCIPRRQPSPIVPAQPIRAEPVRTAERDVDVIAIGSSTGGVEALQTLLAGFTRDCPPTLIVQHVDARFAAAIARTLDAICPARVQLAEPDLPLKAGNVYLAPGDTRHLTVAGSGAFHSRLRQGERISGHLPSVDALFLSVAEVVGARAVGILLTGMGSDGAKGLLAMAQAGAHTIAQDEASCTVFGMPRAAIALGAARVVAPIGRIAGHALKLVA